MLSPKNLFVLLCCMAIVNNISCNSVISESVNTSNGDAFCTKISADRPSYEKCMTLMDTVTNSQYAIESFLRDLSSSNTQLDVVANLRYWIMDILSKLEDILRNIGSNNDFPALGSNYEYMGIPLSKLYALGIMLNRLNI